MKQRRFAMILTLILAVASQLAQTRPSFAIDTCPATTVVGTDYRLTADKVMGSSDEYACIVQFTTPNLQAGQSLFFYGVLDALKQGTSNNDTKNMLQALLVKCGSDLGVRTEQNNLGSELATAVRFLFTAPAPGAYVCQLRARGKTTDYSGTLTAYATKTHLSYGGPKVGNQWIPTETAPISLSPGSTLWFMNSGNYTIHAGISTISVYSGVSFTNCYDCSGASSSGSATVSTQVAALLTNSGGNECASVPRQYFTVTQKAISAASHHQKLHNGYFSVVVPASRPTDCNYYKFKVLVKAVSGNPAVVEIGTMANGIAYDN